MTGPQESELEPTLAAVLRASLEHLAGLAAGPARAPGAVGAAQAWSPELPTEGLGAGNAVAELADLARRAGLFTAGPRTLHYVVGGVTPAALGGAWLAAAFDPVASSWRSSPAAARVEEVALAWLKELLDLPAAWTGVLTSGASLASQTCLAAARQWWGREQGVDVARDGVFGLEPPVVLASGAVHASLPKALAGLGLGARCVRRLGSGPDGDWDLQALEAELADLGQRPALLLATAGDVQGGRFDDLPALAERVRASGARVWIHVDGAFGLVTRASRDRRAWTAGLEHVQSACVDAHKWLNVPTGCGVAFVADKRHLAAPHRLRGGYLPPGDEPRTVFANLGPEMTRPARAFALWAGLAAYGRDGVAAWVERHLDLAAELGRWLERTRGWELVAPVASNVVAFRWRPAGVPGAELDQRNLDLARALEQAGDVELATTRHRGCVGLRAAFVNWRTDEAALERLLGALERAAAALAAT